MHWKLSTTAVSAQHYNVQLVMSYMAGQCQTQSYTCSWIGAAMQMGRQAYSRDQTLSSAVPASGQPWSSMRRVAGALGDAR